MGLKDIENAIIERLQQEIAGIKVEGFPDNATQYNFTHPIAAILVVYEGSDFTASRVLDHINQIQILKFSCVLISRGLHATQAHRGAYTYLDQIRESLTGFQITGFSKMQPTNEEFIGEDNGIWSFSITFSFNGRNEEA